MVRVFSLMSLFLFLFSCKNDEHKLLSLDIDSYRMQKKQEDYKKDINYLKLQNDSLLKNIDLKSVMNIYDFSMKYFSYLDSIQKLCSNDDYNPFFYKGRRGDITEIGNEFIKETNIYLSELNNAEIISPVLKERGNHLLNVEDFQYKDEWYAVYLDYYFRGVNCETFSFLIENRKRDVLVIQNQILNEILLHQCQDE